MIRILANDTTITACFAAAGCLVPPLVAAPAGPPPSSTKRLARWIQSIVIGQCYASATVIITLHVRGLPQNILLFHHVRQGEGSRVTAQFATHTGWAAALTAAGISAGICVITTCAERGKMNYVHIQLSPFL